MCPEAISPQGIPQGGFQKKEKEGREQGLHEKGMTPDCPGSPWNSEIQKREKTWRFHTSAALGTRD